MTETRYEPTPDARERKVWRAVQLPSFASNGISRFLTSFRRLASPATGISPPRDGGEGIELLDGGGQRAIPQPTTEKAVQVSHADVGDSSFALINGDDQRLVLPKTLSCASTVC